MNGFERHGIKHLSASSLNLWTALPGLWALRYLCGFKDTFGPAAMRGTAVEAGMLHLLHDQEDPLAVALRTFDEGVQGEISDAIDAERAMIPGMMDQVAAWQPPSALRASQIKIECRLDGLAVPIIGFVDFSFDNEDVDLKTTKACPSKPKADHVRQVAIYRTARNKGGKLLYITKNKQAEFDVTDEMRDAAIEEITLTANSLGRYLGTFDSTADAVRCLPIDRDNFRWSAPAERAYRDALSGRLSAADMRVLADIGWGNGFEAVQIAERE